MDRNGCNVASKAVCMCGLLLWAVFTYGSSILIIMCLCTQDNDQVY